MLHSKQIDDARNALNAHPMLVGGVLRDLTDIRVFMQHHVFAVWDFMCLIKTLQHAVVPSTTIWVPQPHTLAGRYINEVILAEETDIGPTGEPTSHYDLYIGAMLEIGADTTPVETFIDGLTTVGWHILPNLLENIPLPAERFCRSTLDIIGTHKPHAIAAAFAYGRETVIPTMFTEIVKQLDNASLDAPLFRYYLQRHIDVDGEEHGPLSLQMVDQLCEDVDSRIAEAHTAALNAIQHRITFWTEVQRAIEEVRT